MLLVNFDLVVEKLNSNDVFYTASTRFRLRDRLIIVLGGPMKQNAQEKIQKDPKKNQKKAATPLPVIRTAEGTIEHSDPPHEQKSL